MIANPPGPLDGSIILVERLVDRARHHYYQNREATFFADREVDYGIYAIVDVSHGHESLIIAAEKYARPDAYILVLWLQARGLDFALSRHTPDVLRQGAELELQT